MAQRQSLGLDFSQGVSALTPPLPTWSRDTGFPSQLLDLQIDAETKLFKEEISARDSREIIHRSALNLLVFLFLRHQLQLHICITSRSNIVAFSCPRPLQYCTFLTHSLQLLHSTHIVQHRIHLEEIMPLDPKKAQDELKKVKSDEYVQKLLPSLYLCNSLNRYRVRPLHYTAAIEAAVGAYELHLRMLRRCACSYRALHTHTNVSYA